MFSFALCPGSKEDKNAHFQLKVESMSVQFKILSYVSVEVGFRGISPLGIKMILSLQPLQSTHSKTETSKSRTLVTLERGGDRTALIPLTKPNTTSRVPANKSSE